jgi:hypothetical protein
VYVPDAVGVPERVPPEERRNPGGNEPEVTEKLYGDVPPLADIVRRYATPNVPTERPAGDTVITGQEIETVYLSLPAHWFWSIAVTVKEKFPPAVGVPDRTPPLESVSPGGSDPAVTEKAYGGAPPDAVIVWL